jgi:hypothetical protein
MPSIQYKPTTAITLAGCGSDPLGQTPEPDAALRADGTQRTPPLLHPPQQNAYDGEVDHKYGECDGESCPALQMDVSPAKEDELENSKPNAEGGQNATVPACNQGPGCSRSLERLPCQRFCHLGIRSATTWSFRASLTPSS